MAALSFAQDYTVAWSAGEPRLVYSWLFKLRIQQHIRWEIFVRELFRFFLWCQFSGPLKKNEFHRTILHSQQYYGCRAQFPSTPQSTSDPPLEGQPSKKRHCMEAILLWQREHGVKKKIIKQCQTWQPNIELKTTTKCLTHVQSMDLLWASDTRKVNHAWRIQSFLLANWQAHSEALFIKKGKMHCRHCAWENCYLWKIGTKE